MLDIRDRTPCVLVNKYHAPNCRTILTSHSAVCPQRYVCTTPIRHLHGLDYRVQSQSRKFNFIHYISCTSEQLCTLLATHRFYVRYQIGEDCEVWIFSRIPPTESELQQKWFVALQIQCRILLTYCIQNHEVCSELPQIHMGIFMNIALSEDDIESKSYIARNIKCPACWIDPFVCLFHVHSQWHTHIKQAAAKWYAPVHVILPCRHVTTAVQPAVITGFSSNCRSSLIPYVHHLKNNPI